MSIAKVEEVRDFHGASRTVVTEACDGPGCELTIKSNEEGFAEWGTFIGFVDHDEFGNVHWCSPVCFYAWTRERLHAVVEAPS